MPDSPYAAIILAGGAARRLGGVVKPAIRVAGVPMIERVLAATAPAGPAIVVGHADVDLRFGVSTISESPPGGGPVAAVGAAFAAFGSKLGDAVAILGGDLPLLRAEAVAELLDVACHGRADGAVYVDADGRRQWLCGAWRTAGLAGRLTALAEERGDLAGAALRDLFGPLTVAEVSRDEDPPPWFDCDTEEDIRRAEEWLTR